jgi:hypothetical protein
MIERIAIWASHNNVSFAAFSAMVAVWSDDPDYWSSQSLSRLHMEATGGDERIVSPAIFRI